MEDRAVFKLNVSQKKDIIPEQPTIKDVAARAGVSIATVSYVINDVPRVAERTRKKVLKAIEELNYRPNAAARSLQGKKTLDVAYLVPGLLNLFFSHVALGAEDIAFQHDVSLLICDTNADIEREAQYVENLISRNIDGVLWSVPTDPANVERVLQYDIPVVFLEYSAGFENVPIVEIDNESGVRLAIKHLIELGHHRIMAIVGKLGLSFFGERLTGYRLGLLEAGIEYDESLVVGTEDIFRQEDIPDLATYIASHPSKPTAVFVYQDQEAVLLIKELAKLGIYVPDDLSVVAVDDLYAPYATPELTVLRQPVRDLGRLGCALLIEEMEEQGFTTASHIKLESTLVVRSSTGPPRKEHMADL
jgi:DNA-binding LacI/PurR family transcriptional regulator